MTSNFKNGSFPLENCCAFELNIFAENKTFKCFLKSHSDFIHSDFKKSHIIQKIKNLRFWSLDFIYQLLIIYYLSLLCGDVKPNPGPNLANPHNRKLRKRLSKLCLFTVFYKNMQNVNNKCQSAGKYQAFTATRQPNVLDNYRILDKR